MTEKIRIAQIKVYPEKGDLAGNYCQLMTLLDALEIHNPDVVITPECFLDGYVVTEAHVTRDNLTQYAIDPATSEYVRNVADWAARRHTWVVMGCTRAADGGAYNTALILNREGKLAGLYDKVHWQTHDQKFMPGQRLPVFASDFGPFGVMICADRRWPETVRSLALQGARIIFNPTYGMHNDLNLCMMRTRAYESEVMIAFTHPGQALITGPGGYILRNETSPDVPFVVTEVDLSEVDRARAGASAHLRDRRPDVYTL